MKLKFRLLLIDDNPDSIRETIVSLHEYLGERGFALFIQDSRKFSKFELERELQKRGKNIDLVLVDFNLGQEDFDGTTAAQSVRSRLRYTDIVFYSSDPAINLYTKLAELNISGVYVVNRENLAAALEGVADTIIGKAIDLNHMRGITMAEVAEMDLLMGQTITSTFIESSDDNVKDVISKTRKSISKSARQNLNYVRKMDDFQDIIEFVKDSRKFSSMQKYNAIKRLASKLTDPPESYLSTFHRYEEAIIKMRNVLAHVMESENEDGSVELSSIHDGEKIIIDDEWMDQFRVNLEKQRIALEKICKAIKKEFSVIDAT